MNALICTTCDILQRAISTEWVRIGCLPVATVLLNAIDLLQVFFAIFTRSAIHQLVNEL